MTAHDDGEESHVDTMAKESDAIIEGTVTARESC